MSGARVVSEWARERGRESSEGVGQEKVRYE